MQAKKTILKEKVLNIMHDDNISKVDSDENEASNTDTDNSNESTYVSRSETESDTEMNLKKLKVLQMILIAHQYK